MPFISVRDGQRLHVRVVGKGKPFVLLHGFGMNSRAWLPFVLPLAHRHRFVLPDLRGFGASHGVPLNQACPITNYAEDLEDVLDGLGLERVALGGISMGAFTALQSFRLFGDDRVSRYLHVDQGPVIHNGPDWSFGLFGDDQRRVFDDFRALIQKLDALRPGLPYDDVPIALRREIWSAFGAFAARSFTSVVARETIRRLGSSESIMRRTLPVERWQTYIDIMRAYLAQAYDLRDTVARTRVPITFVIGGASRMYPPEGQRRMARLARQSTSIELPRIGHAVHMEGALRFARILGSFLEGH